ncbi:hypothetical protein BGZ95_011535 [Linnemannia exigua]|uniref:Ubinuclein middle domain-containing protein n=1 Tax=Linnemannia exigua TaxID=604196 RepID=A0AAD4DJU4_9FUNG|nr:hypothetical protein BGZ95_011535 [Linnemannia exigua]
MPSSFQQGSSSAKTSIRGAGLQFSRSDAELASILARPRGEQTQVTNDGVRVFVDLSKHTIVNFVDLVAQQHAQRTLARKKEAKLAKKQQHAKRIVDAESSDAMEVDAPEETGPESATHSEAEGDGDDGGESVGESDNSDNSDSSEDSNDDNSDNPPPKKDFLDNLMDRFEKLYYVLDEEDEEERRAHEEGRPQKKRSRWDFESYDVNDDFIDDSEAMVQSMGIKLKPKESGFYVCRGPLEMVPVDEPAPGKRRGTGGGATGGGGGRRRAPAGAAATSKGSNLAIVESAIEWTSEVSEAEKKSSSKSSNGEAAPKKKRTTKAKGMPADDADNDTNNDSDKQTKAPATKRTKAKSTKTQVAESTTAAADVSAAESPAAANTTTTPTPPSESTPPKPTATTATPKASSSSKTKNTTASKAAAAVPSSTSSIAAIPIVTIESPPASSMDGVEDHSTPHPPPSRPASPLKSKPRKKSKATAAQTDGALSADPATDDALTEDDTAQHGISKDTGADPAVAKTTSKVMPPTNAADQESKSRTSSPAPQKLSQSSTRDDGLDAEDVVTERGPKPEEPLPEELRPSFKAIEELVEKERWDANDSFPLHLRTAMFTFGHLAIEYCKGSGKIIPEMYFDHLRSLMPYQNNTFRKLIYRVLLPNWIKDLEFEKTKLIGQFTERTNKILLTSGLSNQAAAQDADGEANSGDEERPQKKFPWTHDLRLLLWETMEMFMEIRQAKHELHLVRDSYPAPPTDSKTRKDAYQTLLASFPNKWTTSYEISRQYSQLKEKVQKQRVDKKEVEVVKPILTSKVKAVSAGSAGSQKSSKATATSSTGPSAASSGKLARSTSSTKLTTAVASTVSSTKPPPAATPTTPPTKPTPAATPVASSTKSTAAVTSTTSPPLPTKTPTTAATASSSPLLTNNSSLPAVSRGSTPSIARPATPSAPTATGTIPTARSSSTVRRATATPEPPQPLTHHAPKPQPSQQAQHRPQSQQPPHSQVQQQAPRTHFSYTGGPMSNSTAASSLGKKRKNSEGVAQGSGSSNNPLVIDESQEQDMGYDRRRSPQAYYRDSGYPSQVSYSSQDLTRASPVASNKKAKASPGDYGDYGGPTTSTTGLSRGMESTASYSGYQRGVGSSRGGRAVAGPEGRARDGPAQTQQPPTVRRTYSPPPPPMQQQRIPPVYRSRQPEATTQYRDNLDIPSYHHHRQQQHEMPGTGGGGGGEMYSSSMHSRSPPMAPSSSPGPGSGRHPGGPLQRPPSHQRTPDEHLRHPGTHRSHQSSSTHYSHRR